MSQPPSIPPLESFKVDSKEAILQQIERFQEIMNKLKENKTALVEIVGDAHKEFLDTAGEDTFLGNYKTQVEALTSEDEIKLHIEGWNEQIGEKHQKFFGTLDKIRQDIEAKFPGGYEAFKQKHG